MSCGPKAGHRIQISETSMSLFSSRVWWESKPGNDEEFDHGGLCVANVDNDPSGSDKIVTGSFQGLLRIYHPKQAGQQVDDLMLETNLDAPILQLSVGKFVPNLNALALAVLHPRKLSVFLVRAIGGGSGGGPSHLELSRQYDHKLDRSAYNMCHGPFGGATGRDYMCIQSLDGCLSIFEQDAFSFTRPIPSLLVPGPICYVPKLDSFLVATPTMEIECYKYQVLATSSSTTAVNSRQANRLPEEEEAEVRDGVPLPESRGVGKRLQTDWTVSIGENARDIYIGRTLVGLTPNQFDILVIGEHSLFWIREGGVLKLQKRIDFNASASCLYTSGSEDMGGVGQHLLIGSQENVMMVFKETHLLWTSRVDFVPVAIRVSSFGSVKGLVVGMDERGHVVVSYMGTDPGMPQASMQADAKDLDYEGMDNEHRKLLKMIRDANNDTMVEPTEQLTMRATVPLQLDASNSRSDEEDADVQLDEMGRPISVTVKVFISYNGRESLDNVSLSIECPSGFMPDQRTVHVPVVRGVGNQTPLSLSLRFRVSNRVLPTSQRCTLIAAYNTPNGEPRTAQCEWDLPLNICGRVVAPKKSTAVLFTLDSNRAPPALSDLFDDVLRPAIRQNAEIQRHAANTMTLEAYAGMQDCTVLVSKRGGRYRLQANNLESMWLLTTTLCQRLQSHFSAEPIGDPAGPFAISFNEDLPLTTYFDLIDAHFAVRLQVVELKSKLEALAHQFRAVQKRLLARFKDKNPAPLKQMDLLLEETHESIINTADQLEHAQQSVVAAGNRLSCGTNVMLLLIRYKFGMDAADLDILQCYLSPNVDDDAEVGWEEVTDAALTYLLRTLLAKKEQGGSAQPVAMTKDTTKLKKHILAVIEKLPGSHLAATQSGAGGSSKK